MKINFDIKMHIKNIFRKSKKKELLTKIIFFERTNFHINKKHF
jgi:hypothetical protein